jgi:hypothetical protein
MWQLYPAYFAIGFAESWDQSCQEPMYTFAGTPTDRTAQYIRLAPAVTLILNTRERFTPRARQRVTALSRCEARMRRATADAGGAPPR